MKQQVAGNGTRRRRKFWFDPRFGIGLGLVVASVVGVGAIVTATDRTAVVYAARSSLTAGDTVRAADLVPTKVRLGGVSRLYLAGGALPGAGAVVTRTIAAGELIPVSAVGAAAGVSETSVVVNVQGRLAASIAAGSPVDVWSAEQLERAHYAPPAVLVDGATVVRLIEGDGVMVNHDGVEVEVLVPRKKVAAVLEAVANGDVVSVVPDSTPLGR